MMFKTLISAVIVNVQRFHVSLGVWAGFLLIFLAIELPPIFWAACPWETLSETSWDSESAWHPAKLVFAVFLFVLALHIVQRIPAGWLITVVVGAAIALGVHLILVKTGHHPAWLSVKQTPHSYVRSMGK